RKRIGDDEVGRCLGADIPVGNREQQPVARGDLVGRFQHGPCRAVLIPDLAFDLDLALERDLVGREGGRGCEKRGHEQSELHGHSPSMSTWKVMVWDAPAGTVPSATCTSAPVKWPASPSVASVSPLPSR